MAGAGDRAAVWAAAYGSASAGALLFLMQFIVGVALTWISRTRRSIPGAT